MPLILKNPHSVLTTFARRPGDVLSLTLASPNPRGAWGEVLERARAHDCLVTIGADKQHGARRRPAGKSGREGSNEAAIRGCRPVAVEELFKNVIAARPDLWIALDQIQDPHNVGAIFRTAAFFGVKGLIFTRDRSAPLTGVVYDTASGAVETIPFAQPPNLRAALTAAKKAGVWILGSSEHTSTDVFDIPRDRPWLLVLGNENSGMRRLTAEQCDQTCRLVAHGDIGSLNVSVAAGALLAVLARR